MKNFLLSILLTIVSISAFCQDKKSLAEVNQYGGVYVFFACKPVQEYEFIATMRKTCVANSVTDSWSKYAVMAKKEHPDCDAIIFHDMVLGFSKDVFDVVKFKK